MEPIRDNVLIKLKEEEESSSGIITVSNEKKGILKGTVMEVGKDVKDVSQGDVVYFDNKPLMEEDNTVIIKEEHLLAKENYNA